MTLKLCKKALRLFNNQDASKETNRHNARKWLKAVEFLGDKWILANQIQKL
jgi:hypothetical protein